MPKSISDLDQAKYDIVHKGRFKAEKLAKLTSICYGTLCNKVNVTSPNHHLMVDEAIKIQEIQDTRHLIEAEARELGGVYIRIPIEIQNTSDVDLIEAWANWHKDIAETGEAVSLALQSKSVTRHHLADIRREIFEDAQRAMELYHRLEVYCDE